MLERLAQASLVVSKLAFRDGEVLADALAVGVVAAGETVEGV